VTTEFRYQSGHKTGAVLRSGLDTRGTELRYIPGSFTEEEPGGVNIKGYDRITGELLWEHVGQPITGSIANAQTGSIVTKDGRLPVWYWVESERDDIGATIWVPLGTSFLFPSRTPTSFNNAWAVRPNSQFVIWEKRIKYIDMETGESTLSTVPTEYVAMPKEVVGTPFSPANPGDPNLVAIPSISFGSYGTPASYGECSGGLLWFIRRPFVYWQCMNPHEPDTATQLYRFPGRRLWHEAYYTAQIPAWDGNPAVEVEWDHTAGGDDIAAALADVPQIIAATFTGPGLRNGYSELAVEWADETLQFEKILLNDALIQSDPPRWYEGDIEIWDRDTMEVLSHRVIPGTSINRNRTVSQARVMGNGDVVILTKFDATSDNFVWTYDGSDLTQQLAQHQFTTLATTVTFWIHSAQNHLILNRKTGNTVAGAGGQESDNLGWHIMDFDLNLVAEWWRFLIGALDIFHLTDNFYPSEVAGSSDEPALAVVTQYALFNGFRFPGTLDGVKYDGGTVVNERTRPNATSVAQTVRKYEPFSDVLQSSDVAAMNAPFEVSDSDYSFTGGLLGTFPQFESRRVPVAQGSQSITTVASGVDGQPFGNVLGFSHYIRWWQPGLLSGWRAVNDGTVQWRMGFESQLQDSWATESVASFTDWLEFDADQDDLEAALFDVFGEHAQGGGQFKSNVWADSPYFQGFPGTPEGTVLGLNHDTMLWQDSITLIVFQPWSGGGVGVGDEEHFDLANTAGMTGHFNSGNSTNPARDWALFMNANNTYMKIHVRDSNWPNAPQYQLMNRPLGAIRWEDGLPQWQRYFGESLRTGQNVGCSLIMNYDGSTIVGYGETVESELEPEEDE